MLHLCSFLSTLLGKEVVKESGDKTWPVLNAPRLEGEELTPFSLDMFESLSDTSWWRRKRYAFLYQEVSTSTDYNRANPLPSAGRPGRDLSVQTTHHWSQRKDN